jgi:gliding motility-associated-like protein
MNLKTLSLITLIGLFGAVCTAQQITINDQVSVTSLIENELISGCVEVSNMSSSVNGSVNGFNSFGSFERAGSNFPFESGIVLSTGNVLSGGNTLNTQTLNEGNTNWGTDFDLENTLGITNTYNATSIQFNFISTGNQISFNYILASEEYFGNNPCYYADGFAFLIRPAGSNGPYTNIALIPNTAIPVNTSTIRPEIVGFCPAENASFFDGYNMGDTNYNGRTTVLTASASIVPNEEYEIKLVIADQNDSNYDSAVFIQGSSFNSNVDLGGSIATCADSFELNADIGNPLATYSWYFNEALINVANNTFLNVNQSGNYRVEISIPIAGTNCIIEDTVTVNLSSTQTATAMSDFELCDLNNNGIQTFDLSLKDAEVLASVPPANYNFSYHYSAAAAQANTNPITIPIDNSNNPQTIYVRIEDLDSGCLAYNSFNLIVNALPSITAPTPLEVCDDSEADGITAIDLTIKDAEITNNQPELVVSYHYSPMDAESGNNAIAMPYVNLTTNETLYVRVINSQTGCINTSSLEVVVLTNPVINTEPIFIDACDSDYDGFANFNLNEIVDEVLQGLTGVSISFHETIEDAQSGSNPIVNPSNYQNTTIEEQLVFFRVEDNSTGCATVRSFEIHTNLLLTGTEIRDFSLCDIDNDGVESFNLFNIATVMINNIPDVTINFYLSEDDREQQVNALNPLTPFVPSENSQVIYLEVMSPTCTEFDTIEFIVNLITEFESIGSVDYCDTDQDGFTTIDLSSFDNQVRLGQNEFSVRYFASEADADSNSNALPNFFQNTSNPQTIYARIRENSTGCAYVNSFVINVIPAPDTSSPADIIVCDNDFDGMSNINLNNTINQLVSSTADLLISFHPSEADAMANLNTIATPNSFDTGTITVYARVESTITDCISIESINIIVNTLPQFEPISNYRICDNGSGTFADFFFNTKDAEILNGQSGKRVLYFENLSDADNRVGMIDKTTAYQNTSNPQTIYVRVENISDTSCYDTSSFTIEVGSIPAFNEPTDLFLCDDISNNGSETIDLQEKINEIALGINDNLNITFHLSEAAAINNQNNLPINFTNSINPQTIHARVDNGTICVGITSFTINIIQVPQVNAAPTLTTCDDDYDGITHFDLTSVANNILDVRQENITTAYFETIQDLDANQNAILTPTNYNNLTNPQTVYFKVTNTISNCYVAVPITLEVALPPAIDAFNTYEVCFNDSQEFNLNEINNVIVDDVFNLSISYFTTETDAQNNTNALPTIYSYQTANDVLFARVSNNTNGCLIIHDFILQVNPLPTANQPEDLEGCDDDFDGLLFFDLSVQTNTVLGGQSAANFTVSYYRTLLDAQLAQNTLDTDYQAQDMDDIYVRVENNTTRCFSTTQFSIIVNPRPVVEIPTQVICLDLGSVTVSADTNNPDDIYLWSNGATTPEIEISQIGAYSVTVTSIFGCETTVNFDVIESEPANIEVVEVIDFSDPNNITITVNGIGNYAYSLDGEAPQSSNVFEIVTLGYHTITIIDLNGCAEISREVLVIDAPKFMTPNNDGYFDTWHISGVATLPGTKVNIFDRYGKLLTVLDSRSAGWDGNFNGQPMPTNDYWFVANVVQGDRSFEVRGHFTLKR